MLSFLSSIVDSISMFFKFIGQFLTNVVELIFLFFKAVSYLMTLVAFIPVQYRVVLIALLSFAIIIAIVKFGNVG